MKVGREGVEIGKVRTDGGKGGSNEEIKIEDQRKGGMNECKN